jgi:DoxX-like family
MNSRLKKSAIPAFRWVLGLVVLWESAFFALAPAAAHQFDKIGLPQWIRPALGGSEAIAALLFLIPAASVVGGYALLFIFAVAAVIHLLHGQYDIGLLAVYGMGVIVCITHGKNEGREAPHDR